MALNVAADGIAAGVVPLLAGLLAAFVAYGRWQTGSASGAAGDDSAAC